MASRLNHLGDAIGLLIAGLYTVAGQAHFTDRLTPDLASNIETMTQNTYVAFGGLGMNYAPFKQFLGAFDLAAAMLLLRKSTRRTGLLTAVVGFGGGLYGQISTGKDITQVAAFLGLAVVGLLCSG
ncbi:hypothetical protein LTR86_007898 [Recurvomyces mirabilis]|nr:hypothetical protein LTR86_007898 [Recurvomyces mirabilis]